MQCTAADVGGPCKAAAVGAEERRSGDLVDRPGAAQSACTEDAHHGARGERAIDLQGAGIDRGHTGISIRAGKK